MRIEIDSFYARNIKYRSIDSKFKVERPDVAEMIIQSILDKVIGQ